MRLQLLRPEDYLRTPWKNGLGFTDQIAIHPQGSDLRRGDFLWRISSARIEKNSPFSPFPKHDRFLVVLEGAGLRLSHAYEDDAEPEVMELPPLEPYEFPGDIPTRCELIDGPVRDLSVFLAKGRVSVLTDRMTIPPNENREFWPEGTVNFAFVARGRITLKHQAANEGETLRIDLSPGEPQPNLPLEAGDSGAEVILIQIATS